MTEVLLEPLKPVYAHSWPESEAEVVNILCEGPSAHARQGVLRKALEPGPVIAVNRAIAFSGSVPIDCWAFMDDPRFLWDWAKLYLHQETKLFSGDDCPNILMLKELLGDEGLPRLYTRQATYMDQPDLVWAGMTKENPHPMVPTIFHVLAWALQVGAKRVNLIGADMRGSSSPLMENWSETEDEGDQFRWAVERKMMALSIQKYRAKGARIERWNPSKNLK